MNLRQLECLRAVMVTGTMTRAAEILGISQPAVTNLIANLEHEIGFALFRRRRGRLQATPEATHFYEDVERTLGSLDQTAETARQIRSQNLGQLVIATYPGIAMDFLPLVISEFMDDHPDVRFKLLSRSSHVVREMIPLQQFDLGILELPVDHPAVETEKMRFECCCVVPEGHPLSRHKVITPQQLDGVPFITLFRDHMTYFRIAEAFVDAGAEWKVMAETQYFATCCSFVAFGAGVSIVHPVTAAFYENRGLVTRRFEPKIHYELGIVYPLDRIRSQLLEAFISAFKTRIAPYLDKYPSR